MTEDEAQAWLHEKLNVSRETMSELCRFIAFLKNEAQSQNLIAASTLESVWARHIVDSAQLLTLLPKADGEQKSWLDLGSGAGFPGLIVALLSDYKVCLVESRARRIDYLERAVQLLDLTDRVHVAGCALEKLSAAQYDVISARAFAPLPRLLKNAARFSTENTLWLLPKGQNAVKELKEAQKMTEWSNRLDFAVTPSVTSGDAGILTGHLRQKAGEQGAKAR